MTKTKQYILTKRINHSAILIEQHQRGWQSTAWIWFTCCASILALVLFSDRPELAQIAAGAALLAATGWMVTELFAAGKVLPVLSWHGDRLYLYDRGRVVQTILSQHIQHLDMIQGRDQVCLTIQTQQQWHEQRLRRLGRIQRLQVQRLVRMLQAKLASQGRSWAHGFEQIANDIEPNSAP